MTVVQSSSLGITSLASTADSSTQNNAIGHHHYLSAYQQSTTFTYQDQQQLSDNQHQLNGSTQLGSFTHQHHLTKKRSSMLMNYPYQQQQIQQMLNVQNNDDQQASNGQQLQQAGPTAVRTTSGSQRVLPNTTTTAQNSYQFNSSQTKVVVDVVPPGQSSNMLLASSPKNPRATKLMNMTMSVMDPNLYQAVKAGNTTNNKRLTLNPQVNPFQGGTGGAVVRNGGTTTNGVANGSGNTVRQKVNAAEQDPAQYSHNAEELIEHQNTETTVMHMDSGIKGTSHILQPNGASSFSPMKAFRQTTVNHFPQAQLSQTVAASLSQAKRAIIKNQQSQMINTISNIANPQNTNFSNPKGASERNGLTTQARPSQGGSLIGQSNQQQQQQLIIITVSQQGPPNLSAGTAGQKKSTLLGSTMSGGNSSMGTQGQSQASDHKDPKQALLMSIQEVVRLVIQRFEDINQLRQVIDLKIKKLKSKYTDSSFFYNLLQREWQRQSVEGYHLNKTGNVRVEDKSPLIKTLQKQVKKMMKPFNRRKPQVGGGPGNEDYLNSEVHLSEILLAQDTESATSNTLQSKLETYSQPTLPTMTQLQSQLGPSIQLQLNMEAAALLTQSATLPQYKELRKRNYRIIQASYKEQLVDPQVSLSICIQASRQAFFDEIFEYFLCAHDIITAGAPGTVPSNCNLQTENFNYQNLKKVIHKAKMQSRVQINLQKKLDKVFKSLFDQNTEILKQINVYKDSHHTKKQLQLHSQSESPQRNHKKLIAGGGGEVLSNRHEDRRQSQPPDLLQTSSLAMTSQIPLSKGAVKWDDQSLNASQKIQKYSQPTVSAISELIRPLNTTMSSFAMSTPLVKKSGGLISIPLKQQSHNDIIIGQFNLNCVGSPNQPSPFNPSATMFAGGNAGSILKGPQKASKLQPIVARDKSLTGIKKQSLPQSIQGELANHQLNDPTLPPLGATTKLLGSPDFTAASLNSASKWEVSRTIKKLGQLPSLQTNTVTDQAFPQLTQVQLISGSPTKQPSFSRRGLDPISLQQQQTEQNIIKSTGDSSQSLSPLKRRPKVVIHDVEGVTLPHMIQGSFAYEQDHHPMLNGSSPLLLKVSQQTAQGAPPDRVQSIFSNQNLRTAESQDSNQRIGQEAQQQPRPESGRKVIKATITIPLPKADMGVFTSSSRSKKRRAAQKVGPQRIEDGLNSDEMNHQNSLLLNDDDEDSNDLMDLDDDDRGYTLENDQDDRIILIEEQDQEEVLVPNHASLLIDSSPAVHFIQGSSSDSQVISHASYQSYQGNAKMNYLKSGGGKIAASQKGYSTSGHSPGYSSHIGNNYSPAYNSNIDRGFNNASSFKIFTQATQMLLDITKFPVNDRFDSLFSRYFNKKGILAFIVQHRARVLQRFFRARMARKLAAKKLIVKRFRFYVARQQRLHLFATKLLITVTQKKSVRAIERAYLRHRNRLRSTKLTQEQVYECEERGLSYLNRVINIQRFYRKRLLRRYDHGRLLVKRKEMYSNMVSAWWQQRYRPIVPLEARMLQIQTKHQIDRRLIDEYVYAQQESYVANLSQYDPGLIKAVETNYRERDWSYNGGAREWCNDKMHITFKGAFQPPQQNQTSTNAVLPIPLQYLIDSNRRLLLTGPCQSFEDIQGVSEAVSGLLLKTNGNQRRELLSKIKRVRHSALLETFQKQHPDRQANSKTQRCRSK